MRAPSFFNPACSSLPIASPPASYDRRTVPRTQKLGADASSDGSALGIFRPSARSACASIFSPSARDSSCSMFLR